MKYDRNHQLKIVQVNQHASAVEPMHADFIWKFSGLPELWLADQFPSPEPSPNGLLPYFESDLLHVFTNSLMRLDQANDVLIIAPTNESENPDENDKSETIDFPLAVALSMTAVKSESEIPPSKILTILTSEIYTNQFAKFLPKEVTANLKIEAVESLPDKQFDRIIIIQSDSAKGELSKFSPPGFIRDRIKDSGMLGICDLSNSDLPSGNYLNDLATGLSPLEIKLPIGKPADSGIIFDPEDCDWGPGHICLFEK